jgi:hypothetical protein
VNRLPFCTSKFNLYESNRNWERYNTSQHTPSAIYVLICLQVYSCVLNVKGTEKLMEVFHQRPMLNSRSVYTVSVQDTVTLERTSLQVLRVSLLIIIPPMLHHPCLVQCVQLRPKCQWKQSHQRARVQKNPRLFMGTEDSLPFSRQSASGYYSQLDGCRSTFILHFF